MDSGFYSGGSRKTRNCRVLAAESHNLTFPRFTSAAVLRMDYRRVRAESRRPLMRALQKCTRDMMVAKTTEVSVQVRRCGQILHAFVE